MAFMPKIFFFYRHRFGHYVAYFLVGVLDWYALYDMFCKATKNYRFTHLILLKIC